MGARMTKCLVVVLMIQVILIITNIADIPGSGLYNFLTNPSDWGFTSLLSFLNDILLVAGVAVVAVGTFFRNDLLTFSGLSSIVLSFGMSLGSLFSIIKDGMGNEVAIFIVSPIVLLYVWTTIAFWRGMES